MLNEESRKYFNRAYLASGAVFNYWALDENDHLKKMQEYAKIDDVQQLIEYLKTLDSESLGDCYSWDTVGNLVAPPWLPTIESSETDGAFLTKTPDEIYASDNPPVMDTLIAFNSHV